MKAKPPIYVARADPFASAAAMHFDRVKLLPFRAFVSGFTL